MSRKAGFGLFALLICLVGGPWDGPPVRVEVTPVAPVSALASIPLAPMSPLERPSLFPEDDLEVMDPAEEATPAVRKGASVTRPQSVRVVHAPAKRGARHTARAAPPRKSPYAIGKQHYPYVRPKDWPPGYPVS